MLLGAFMSLPALAALQGFMDTASATCGGLPGFHVTLRPDLRPEGYLIHGEVLLDGTFAANETLAVLPLSVASVPSAQYEADGVTATDDDGPVPLTSRDDASGPFGMPSRYWVAERATRGPVSYSFTAEPAVINVDARPGPLFDIRNGTGGLTGSIWALVPVPDPMGSEALNMTVSWDIPDTQAAAFTWADGQGPHSHSFTGPITDLLHTFFIIGNVASLPAMPFPGATAPSAAGFGMYWLEADTPPFDTDSVAAWLESLLEFQTAFWEDDSDRPYRVFLRVNAETSTSSGGSGTALPRSFTMGYNPDVGVVADRLETLLAHEMTHNWTPWLGDGTTEQSRYNEGAAEYWSLRLLWRAGLLTAERFLEEMNSRAVGYYTKSVVNMSDAAAQEAAWQVRDAQRIPYGRGMLHFTNVDAQMREASDGARSLDDLAVDFVRVCREVAACGSEEWFEILGAALGEDAVDEWKQVSTGTPLIKPVEGSLGPCLEVVLNGTQPTIWTWQAKEGVDISSEECLI